MNLFDFVDAASSTKKDLFDGISPDDAKVYNQFMVARAFSMFPDTILYANETNRYSEMRAEEHFAYFLHSLRPRRRRTRWPKKGKADDAIKAIAETCGMSLRKAEVAASLMTDEQLKELTSSYGGPPHK